MTPQASEAPAPGAPGPVAPFDPTRQPGIRIAQVMVERASFAHRADYLSFEPSTVLNVEEVELELQLSTSPDQRGGMIRLQAKTPKESKALYEFDVVMIGLVEVEPDKVKQNMPVPQYMITSGTALLYPFVRELVANLTGRGRFGPLWLAPSNIMASIGSKTISASTK